MADPSPLTSERSLPSSEPTPPVGTPSGGEVTVAQAAARLRRHRVAACTARSWKPCRIRRLDGRIKVVNRQTEVLFGYARKALVGQPMERLLSVRFHLAHQQHRMAYMAAPDVRPMGLHLPLVGRAADGSEFPVEVSLSPLEQDGELWVIASMFMM